MICRIQWIDASGEKTPDQNHAVGIAVCTFTYKDGRSEQRRFPICAEHHARMPRSVSRFPGGSSSWTFEPLFSAEPSE